MNAAGGRIGKLNVASRGHNATAMRTRETLRHAVRGGIRLLPGVPTTVRANDC